MDSRRTFGVLAGELARAAKQIGLGERGPMGHERPKGMSGDELKKWRLTTPASKPNEFSTRGMFARWCARSAKGLGRSPMFRINFDTGQFTAVNDDAANYPEQKHDKILLLHVKDRKNNHGDNVSWGEGNRPIQPVLQRKRAIA